ncbi:MAG: cellulase family glycosylhydrolase [Bacteroidales bacterium]
MNRRNFIRNSAMSAAAFSLMGSQALGNTGKDAPKNLLPRWRGFNLLDYFSPYPARENDPNRTMEDDFRWMADWGFDFVRIPMAYPRYLDIDRTKQITGDDFYKIDKAVIDEVEKLVMLANNYKLHVSLNLHRAPGYCINAGFYEPYNLWKDKEAQDAFNYHWGMWAERFKGIPKEQLSFDLLNEPAYREDMNDQFSKSSALPGDLYRKVAKGAADAIRAVSGDRLIIADGNNVGNDVVPELFDLNMGQSCRGYYPHYVSHYQAGWVWKNPADAPMPVWPGVIDGQNFSRQTLEDYYRPWTELVNKGVGVHCGECGCWRNTPHEVFLAWFGDIIDILTSNHIGYALWNFRGDFGILDSGRKDVAYTDWYGHKLDSKLLELLKKY